MQRANDAVKVSQRRSVGGKESDTEAIGGKKSYCSSSLDRWVMEQSFVNMLLPLDTVSSDSMGLDSPRGLAQDCFFTVAFVLAVLV